MSAGETSENKELEKIKQRKIEERLEKLEQENQQLKKEIQKIKPGSNKASKIDTKASKGISRRQFLKKAGLSTAGLAALVSPASAGFLIKDDSLSVQTSNDDGGTLTEGLYVGENQNVEISNGNLNMNGNSINNVDEINGEDVDDLGGGESIGQLLGFATFPEDTDPDTRENLYEEFEPLARNAEFDNIIQSDVTRPELLDNKSAMDDIANYSNSMDLIKNLQESANSTGDTGPIDHIIDSQTSMNAISSHQTSWDRIWENRVDGGGYEHFSEQISESDEALGKFVGGRLSIDGVRDVNPNEIDGFNSFFDLTDEDDAEDILSDRRIVDAISFSDFAIQNLSDSNSAISYIENNWNQTSSNPEVASVYLVEIEGAGGGGGHSDCVSSNDAEDSSFGPVVAKGGGGADCSAGSSGGFEINDEGSEIVEGQVGGGASGGSGEDPGAKGGDGGYVKALVANSQMESISTDRAFGARGRLDGEDGDDGSITVWVPPWAED